MVVVVAVLGVVALMSQQKLLLLMLLAMVVAGTMTMVLPLVLPLPVLSSSRPLALVWLRRSGAPPASAESKHPFAHPARRPPQSVSRSDT